jgi:serine/threonine protein phosphatase PrpC
VVCVIRRTASARYVYAANCGDARAVLCHDGRAVRLTRDHKATDPEEVNRIERAGGFVARARVMGVLAVARSFGDFVLKEYVTAEPYTSTTKIDSASSFLIVACDGVWDVFEDQDAVDAVRACAGDDRKRRGAAAKLVHEALARGSTDNVSALVVWL